MGAPFTFYEFFAGGGMARAGLGQGWRCLFANDFDPCKTQTYRANWSGGDLVEDDIWNITPDQLPLNTHGPEHGGAVDLAWASSPCQDLSLAGKRAGLSGRRSSAFWGYWRLIEALEAEGRAPRTVVIENVAGLLSSHAGEDFAELCRALDAAGYRFGALELDAASFLPQSRPRLFIVGVRGDAPALPHPVPPFHSRRVVEAIARLPSPLRARAAWWGLPEPPARNATLATALEPDRAAAWHHAALTERLISLLSPLQRARLESALETRERRVGALYRRTRVENGVRVQRAELRYDGLAGCLRTPGGGSSRQFLIVTEGGQARTRPLAPREAARLMGLPDSYDLPRGETAALHVVGDGVAAPVVRWLAAHLLEPALADAPRPAAASLARLRMRISNGASPVRADTLRHPKQSSS